MINVKTFKVGYLATNCYVITDKDTGKAAVVDAGAKSAELLEYIKEIGAENLEYILLTHGHFDHIMFVPELKRITGAKVVISKEDAPFLYDSSLNLSANFRLKTEDVSADITLSNGDCLVLGNTKLVFISTPGHTVGSGCFVSEKDKIIFSGDTLFKCSMGRTDFVTGDEQAMFASLKKLSRLNGDYKVYPGHNEPTTLEYERNFNPYMR